MTVGDIRKAIEGLPDEADVELSLDSPYESDHEVFDTLDFDSRPLVAHHDGMGLSIRLAPKDEDDEEDEDDEDEEAEEDGLEDFYDGPVDDAEEPIND